MEDLDKLIVICNSATRLNMLVDDLSKHAFNNAPDKMQEVDLNKVMKEVIEDMELMIAEHAIRISILSLPVVMGTKVQLRQLFSNLLINITQFKIENSNVHVSISAEITDCVDMRLPNKKFHKISVTNDSPGKEKAVQPDPGSEKKNEDHVIGMLICKKIMENHAGKIELNSIGNANAFHLYFPLI